MEIPSNPPQPNTTPPSPKTKLLHWGIIILVAVAVGAALVSYALRSQTDENNPIVKHQQKLEDSEILDSQSEYSTYSYESYSQSTPPAMIFSFYVSPSAVTVGLNTKVLASADVGDGDEGYGPTLTFSKVFLLRYTEEGKLIKNYGVMYDDGSHGDLKAKDGRFSLEVSILDTTERRTFFATAASYENISKPVFSKQAYSTIFPLVPSPEQVLQTIANALMANHMDTVKENVYMNERNSRIVERWTINEAERKGMAEVLKQATLFSNDGSFAEFYIKEAPITLSRDIDGTWKLSAW